MKKRHLKAAAGFIVLCMMLLAMIGAAAEDWHLPLMSLNAGTPLTGESFSFSWEKWSGADYYEYSVVDRTSGETIRNHKRTTGRNGSVSSGNLEYGHHLHIWVGAYIDDVLSAQAHGDVYVACGMHEYVNGRCACGEVCDHDWNSKGICKECEMECPHDDTYEKETSITGVSISDTKHELTTTYNEVCWDCYVIVRKGLTKTSTGKHQLDSNGDCTQCDFGSGCAHEKTKHVERTTSYEYLNDDEHRVKVVYDVVCANANCGRLIEYGGYITSEKEAHSFKSGACQYCGFSIATPLSATVSRSASTISLGKNITGRCVATGGSGSYEYAWGGYMGSKKYFSQYYSSESFYTFAPNKVGTWKIHVYVRDKETGDQLSLYTAEFTVTDAVVECTHASYTDVPRSTSEYVKISDSSHKVVTKVDRVCDDCGEVINTTDKVETQAHSYSGGKCTLCGSAQPTPECAHSSMKSTELSRKVRKTDSNAEHVIDITWKDVCASCGETLNTTRTTYIAENHSFDASGVCKCGYVKSSPTCDHADAQKVFVSSRTERSDAQRHVVITTYRLECPCGVIVNPSLEERAHFPHTFEGGKCIHCGEEQVITPPPVTAPPVTPAPEDGVCKVYGDAHRFDPNKYSYEADHDHDLFMRCACGVTQIMEGRHQTANGSIQSPDECCICHGHDWDSANAQKTGENWVETCRKCGASRNATYECEYHHGAHQFTEVLYGAKHPHVGKLACMCGEADPSGVEQGTCSMPTCCECGNHVWMEPFYAISYGQYLQGCTRCGEYHPVQEELDKHISTKFGAGGTLDHTKTFDQIHNFACEANQNGVYVYVNELIKAGSNFTQAAADTFDQLVTSEGEATDKAQVMEWEHIITNTLVDHLNTNASEPVDMVKFADLFSDEDLNALSKYALDREKDYAEYVTGLLTTKRNEVASGIKAYEHLAQTRGLSVQETLELGALQDQQDNLTKGMDDWKKASKTLKVIGIGAGAFVEMVKNEEQQKVFADLANYSYECDMWLSTMIDAAESTGDDNIVTAAENVRDRLEYEQEHRFAGQWLALVETGKKLGTDAITNGCNSALEGLCPALKVISFCADSADITLDWKDSYESSFRLITLHQMMRSMETTHYNKGQSVFDKQTETDMEAWFDISMESGYIMAQLYTEIQKEGLTESKNYLKEYEDGTFLNVEKDFGIDYDSKMHTVELAIKATQRNHEALKQYYDNRDLWESTAIDTEYTNEELWNYDQIIKPNKVKTENEDEQYAKVIGKAILRKDADPNSDYKATKYEGDIVRVLHFKNGWYYVEYDKDCYAYIHNSRVILQ